MKLSRSRGALQSLVRTVSISATRGNLVVSIGAGVGLVVVGDLIGG
jgi:hypothetical protein